MQQAVTTPPAYSKVSGALKLFTQLMRKRLYCVCVCVCGVCVCVYVWANFTN